MPRGTRKLSSTGMYHVMLRGINRQELFHSDDDMNKMISVLSECVQISKSRIHAYCIMPNHIHILIQTGTDLVPDSEMPAQVMKRIEDRYARYYNTKYDRIGSVYQERYRSEPVNSDAYFLTVLRYIHRNPVKAGIVNFPGQYKWSSYHAYINKSGFVYTEMGLAMLGNTYESYMHEVFDAPCIDMDEASQKLTDSELKLEISKNFQIPASYISILPQDEKENALRTVADIYGADYRQISRVTCTSLSAVFRANNRTLSFDE